LGPGWAEFVQKYGSWVWLRQIKSGPSDESRGPDLIMKQFITAARFKSKGLKETAQKEK